MALVGLAWRRRRLRRQGDAPQLPPPNVTIVTTAPKDIPASIELVGQGAASKFIEVRSQLNGVIIERPYQEGSDVDGGHAALPARPHDLRGDVPERQGGGRERPGPARQRPAHPQAADAAARRGRGVPEGRRRRHHRAPAGPGELRRGPGQRRPRREGLQRHQDPRRDPGPCRVGPSCRSARG